MAVPSGMVAITIKWLQSRYILEMTPAELDGSNVRGKESRKLPRFFV